MRHHRSPAAGGGVTAMAVIPWAEDMRATAVEMWKDGASISTIAQKLALTRSAVAGYMNRNRSYFPKTGKSGFNQAEQVAVKRRERNTPKQAATPRSWMWVINPTALTSREKLLKPLVVFSPLCRLSGTDPLIKPGLFTLLSVRSP